MRREKKEEEEKRWGGEDLAQDFANLVSPWSSRREIDYNGIQFDWMLSNFRKQFHFSIILLHFSDIFFVVGGGIRGGNFSSSIFHSRDWRRVSVWTCLRLNGDKDKEQEQEDD